MRTNFLLFFALIFVNGCSFFASDEENCQLLNVISHLIKTNSNETYTSLIDSPESIAKFRTDILLDIIKNSKQGNIPLDREELSKALWS